MAQLIFERCLLLTALFALGCPAKPAAPPPIDLAAPPADGPTFGILNTPEGPIKASPAETVAYLKQHCEDDADNHLAVNCYSLARLYSNGIFVARDLPRALALFRRGCDGGEPRACSELGVMYDGGEGVARDPARARALFHQSCDAGSGLGCNNLILLHPKAATKEDTRYVIARHRAICDGGGDPESCATLGMFFAQGQFVARDETRAVALFDKACSAGHAMGCNNLGAMLALGRGIAKDPARARTLYHQACQLGSKEGCANAGE